MVTVDVSRHLGRTQHRVGTLASIRFTRPVAFAGLPRRTAAELAHEVRDRKPVGVPTASDWISLTRPRSFEFANTQPDSLGLRSLPGSLSRGAEKGQQYSTSESRATKKPQPCSTSFQLRGPVSWQRNSRLRSSIIPWSSHHLQCIAGSGDASESEFRAALLRLAMLIGVHATERTFPTFVRVTAIEHPRHLDDRGHNSMHGLGSSGIAERVWGWSDPHARTDSRRVGFWHLG